MQRKPVTDLVVLVPGIMGSVLARDGRDVWNISPGAGWRGLRSRLGSVAGLRLPPDLGDGHPGDGVEPVDLLGSLHVIPGVWSPVVGYHDLRRWLRRTFALDPGDERFGVVGNLVTFPYDWRLSNRYHARRLGCVVEPALARWRHASRQPEAKVVYICHSMGGLLVRYYLEVLGGRDTCRRLVTLGTPFRGSLAALRQLVAGFGVAGREIPSLSALARSLPALHQLAPAYDCVDRGAGLVRPQAAGLPGPDPALLADAARFHQEIDAAGAARGPDAGYELHAVVGFGQSTPTTLRAGGGDLVWDPAIEGEDEGGDGRVPMLSSTPVELSGVPVERGHVEKHGALPDHPGVREGIEYALTRERRFHRAVVEEERVLRVDAPEVVAAGEPWQLTVTTGDDRLALAAQVTDGLSGKRGERVTLVNQGEGRYGVRLAGRPPGLYNVVVTDPAGAAVTSHLIVWGDDDER